MAEYQNKLPLSIMCDALNYPRASFYRSLKKKPEKIPSHEKRSSHRRLSESEENVIYNELNSVRFCDMAPAEIYMTLLDEGIYLCSIRTMYRILARKGQTVQRRQSDAHHYTRPEL